MELPVRKNPRLQSFDYSTPGGYFITICTSGKQCLLSTVVGAGALDGPQIRLTKIGEIVHKYIRSTNNIPGLTVDKYVIMPNHVHLILFVDSADGPSRAPAPTNAAIPMAISALKRLVGREVGQNIWQRGYHDHILRDENDYLIRWKYIDDNPAKWADDDYFIPAHTNPSNLP